MIRAVDAAEQLRSRAYEYELLAAWHEERKFARSAVAADYARYKERTGRFLPKLSAMMR